MSYWSGKQAHGLHWGWWQRKQSAQDWCITVKNYEPCFDITSATRHLVKFGNEWAHNPDSPLVGTPFQHPSSVAHTDWHFLDNPEIPHFLWPNPANESGAKDWVRWVPGEICTSRHTQDGEQRVNSLLKEFSQGRVTDWQQIAPINTVTRNNSRTVLLVPSSPPNFKHYYNTTITKWITHHTTLLERMGYTVETRTKVGRKQRLNNQLKDQLASGKYLCTVSQHSVAAMETIMAGLPAVVTGPHPCGDLATPWHELERGHLRTPSREAVEAWCRTLLGNIRHKREIFTGEWKDA